jgi:hypothetical protein
MKPYPSLLESFEYIFIFSTKMCALSIKSLNYLSQKALFMLPKHKKDALEIEKEYYRAKGTFSF